MRFITLSMVLDPQPYAERPEPQFMPDPEDGETLVEAPATEAPAPAEVTTPVTIQVECVRCFYTRKNNKPGTRITFSDGGGFAVSEPYDKVKAVIQPN